MLAEKHSHCSYRSTQSCVTHHNSLWSISSSWSNAFSLSWMACTSVGVHAAGVSNVATYSHLLGSSTFCSFSVLPHLTDTCAKSHQFKCIVAVDNKSSQGDTSNDDATAYPVMQYNMLLPSKLPDVTAKKHRGFCPLSCSFLFQFNAPLSDVDFVQELTRVVSSNENNDIVCSPPSCS